MRNSAASRYPCGKIAAKNAEEFGCQQEGEIEGLLHDFGKYSQSFQDVLNGKQQKINHAAAGALMVLQKYDKDAAMPLAMAIFAHHSQLESEIQSILYKSVQSDAPCYDKSEDKKLSLSGKSAYKQSWQAFCSEVDLPNVQLKAEKYDYCSDKAIAYMLYVRMVFSALVDADYCSSAEHFNPNYLAESTGAPLNAAATLKKLLDYQQKVKSTSTADQKINRIRNQLFQDCLDAAILPSGLFTLTAPTGTGKTLSLLAFALTHAKRYNKRRIIIVLPYLAIIEQNTDKYLNIEENLLEDHSQSNLDEVSRLFSQRWSAPIIVTTSVNFFETLFASRPTDCRKLHNIANSVIVFDEAQSLPPHLTGVTLDAVNALCKRYKCSVVFSTATQPSFNYRPDISWNPVEIVKNPQEMFRQTRRVQVQWKINKPIPLLEIAKQMANQSSCCAIVNLKAHACELFSALKNECTDTESLFFISTNLCVEHRKIVINNINERLHSLLPCRLVSTQCIEAGVDFDFQTMFRALAPLESIIQAAGRCNRNAREQFGNVILFFPDYPGNLYPDSFYESAANKVRILISRHPIDIDDTNHIDEYYKLLYHDSLPDEKRLKTAISEIDFAETDRHYKLIQTSGVNVIVPYNRALFDKIKTEALKNGLTPSLITEARPITVNSFDREHVKEYCEMLPFHCVSGRYEPEDSNWYLLDVPSAYQKQIGLNFASTGFTGIID